MSNKTEETYFEKFFGKRLDDFMKKWEARPRTQENWTERNSEFIGLISSALTDCVNDIDKRLKKLESV